MSSTLNQIKFIKEKADIIEVISHFVELKRDGANYKGKSPFSDERTASFMVSQSKRIFKDFSSGKSGDVIDFVIAVKGFTYKDALQWISDFYHLPRPESDWQYAKPKPIETSYIPFNLYSQTIDTGHLNYFRDWLGKILDATAAHALLQKYNVGTSKHWPGACIFWQIDLHGRIRSGKIMVYDRETGKRVKYPKPLITWVHKAAKLKNFNLSICLFGEHLLSDPGIVCIVESEKSAILASAIWPKLIWLASGSLTNLSTSRCACLAGRTVILYPDVGGEAQWEEKRLQLAELIPGKWELHPLIGDHPNGYDLCDYILDNLI